MHWTSHSIEIISYLEVSCLGKHSWPDFGVRCVGILSSFIANLWRYAVSFDFQEGGAGESTHRWHDGIP